MRAPHTAFATAGYALGVLAMPATLVGQQDTIWLAAPIAQCAPVEAPAVPHDCQTPVHLGWLSTNALPASSLVQAGFDPAVVDLTLHVAVTGTVDSIQVITASPRSDVMQRALVAVARTWRFSVRPAVPPRGTSLRVLYILSAAGCERWTAPDARRVAAGLGSLLVEQARCERDARTVIH